MSQHNNQQAWSSYKNHFTEGWISWKRWGWRYAQGRFFTHHVTLSDLGKSLTLVSPLWSVQSQSGKDGCKRLGLNPMLQKWGFEKWEEWPSVSFPRTAEGTPVIISGGTTANCGCQNHHHHFTSFLCFLIQDKPEVGEELPFVVEVSRNSSAGRVLLPQPDPPHGHQWGGSAQLPHHLTLHQ